MLVDEANVGQPRLSPRMPSPWNHWKVVRRTAPRFAGPPSEMQWVGGDPWFLSDLPVFHRPSSSLESSVGVTVENQLQILPRPSAPCENSPKRQSASPSRASDVVSRVDRVPSLAPRQRCPGCRRPHGSPPGWANPGRWCIWSRHSVPRLECSRADKRPLTSVHGAAPVYLRRVAEMAEESSNRQEVCRMLGLHHSTYYRWRTTAENLLQRGNPALLTLVSG